MLILLIITMPVSFFVHANTETGLWKIESCKVSATNPDINYPTLNMSNWTHISFSSKQVNGRKHTVFVEYVDLETDKKYKYYFDYFSSHKGEGGCRFDYDFGPINNFFNCYWRSHERTLDYKVASFYIKDTKKAEFKTEDKFWGRSLD